MPAPACFNFFSFFFLLEKNFHLMLQLSTLFFFVLFILRTRLSNIDKWSQNCICWPSNVFLDTYSSLLFIMINTVTETIGGGNGLFYLAVFHMKGNSR